MIGFLRVQNCGMVRILVPARFHAQLRVFYTNVPGHRACGVKQHYQRDEKANQ